MLSETFDINVWYFAFSSISRSVEVWSRTAATMKFLVSFNLSVGLNIEMFTPGVGVVVSEIILDGSQILR